jgi:uncharacterized membrane protein
MEECRLKYVNTLRLIAITGRLNIHIYFSLLNAPFTRALSRRHWTLNVRRLTEFRESYTERS